MITIGITTNIESKKNYWVLFNTLEKKFQAIEICNKKTPIRSGDIPILQRISKKGKKLSIHSATQDFLKGNTQISFSEKEKLKSEIFIAHKINASVIFHLSPNKRLTKKQEQDLKEVLSYAKDKKVELLIENNKEDFPSKKIIHCLKEQRGGLCLDIGHLNIYTKGNTEKQKKLVLENKDLIKEVHCHGNNLKEDKHDIMTQRELGLLNIVPHKALFVIETRDEKAAMKTKDILIRYFKGK